MIDGANVITEHSTLAISLGFLGVIIGGCAWVAVQWSNTKGEIKQLRDLIAGRQLDADSKHAEILRALDRKVDRGDMRVWIAKTERALSKDLPPLPHDGGDDDE